ncbi:copper homeostasis protein CutC [Occallatibacter riparius]|uniref:PF03932 family protein CutC n=1 Tax=Occallatibacter riparius TaxID=1002689 RepID=A0A9J7BV51_9BACT|nr:copper homeostasis protein CutC [Occallatibacter riparius]UWZ86551.1 copper homeostasis protein CutC [Occallatibacter riparius]
MPILNPIFELCAPGLEAAIAAERGGADRIELCSNLPVGGVTPDTVLLESVLGAISIPVHVLIRPRAGDFVYSREEFAEMRHQVEAAKAAGAGGVAIGILIPDGRVDVSRTRELAELARPMSVTFHRGFDEAADLDEALEAVIETGADLLLTSGGAENVMAGVDAIARIRRQAGTRLEIMAGRGLRLENLSEIVLRTGVSCVHGSLTPTPVGNGNGSYAKQLEENVRQAVRLLRDACLDRPITAAAG